MSEQLLADFSNGSMLDRLLETRERAQCSLNIQYESVLSLQTDITIAQNFKLMGLSTVLCLAYNLWRTRLEDASVTHS